MHRQEVLPEHQVELIKRFIGDVLVGLPDDASVEEAYVDFEDKEKAITNLACSSSDWMLSISSGHDTTL